MIRQLECNYEYTDDELEYLDSMKPFDGTYWSKTEKEMKSIKARIREYLRKSQKFIGESNEFEDLDFITCAYCGNRLFETSGDEIEHIAPKGRNRKKEQLHPEYMFTILNLVLACSYCNGFSKKGITDTLRLYDESKDGIDEKLDTIESLESTYEEHKFNIVHPYFDIPDEHYELSGAHNAFIKGISEKGINSIKIFKLDSTQMTSARISSIVYYNSLRESPTTIDNLKVLDSVLSFRP